MHTLRLTAASTTVLLAALSTSVTAQNTGRAPGAGTSASDERTPPVAFARQMAGSIELDGLLDEPDWAAAQPVTEFTQVDPDEGQPVSQPTEVRILYDAAALYIGVRAWDDGQITTRLGRRDMQLLDSDWFGVVIDSYHDHRTGFSFDVNPGGVMRDAVKSTVQGGRENDDLSWDGVWEVATSVDDRGWTAEYRIPFSQLRFRSGDVQRWGIQLERVIGRRREYSVSTFVPKVERGGIATFGHLEGIGDVAPGRRMELLPYGVARSEHVDPGLNPYRTDSEQGMSAGLDLLYRVSSNLTLNATFNPDFGQVEVDPAVVNLGVYETFFQEKRPFFIEGSEIFNFGRRMFYSRRIGRPPQVGPGTSLSDVPTETTILGAGKISGKTANGWSVGILEAVTGRERARFVDVDGTDQTMVAEPLTNYFVGRLRKDMSAGLSSVGAMVTAVNRNLETPLLRSNLRSAAYALGVDFNHEFGGRNWAIRGSATGSRVEGDADAITRVQRASNHYFQRPDADHLNVDSSATSLNGYSARVTLAKQAGRHWLGNVGGAITSGTYEVNDLGFVVRTDRRDLTASLTYRETRPGSFLREWAMSLTAHNEMNFAGDRILRFANLSYRFRHLNFWGASVSLNHRFQALDDRSTRGGPLIIRPRTTVLRVNVNSDGRKPVTLHANGARDWTEFDGSKTSANISLGIKASSRWNLSIGPSFFKARVPAQYVATVSDAAFAPTFGNRYIFAQLDQTQVSFDTRFNFTFKPGLTLELYAQPLISAGEYGAPQYLAEPRTFDFRPFTGTVLDRDFNLRSLRGNAVLRWEWRPGSNIYVAWQQRRFASDDRGDFSFRRDWRALIDADADNIFLVKVNYWLNP